MSVCLSVRLSVCLSVTGLGLGLREGVGSGGWGLIELLRCCQT